VRQRNYNCPSYHREEAKLLLAPGAMTNWRLRHRLQRLDTVQTNRWDVQADVINFDGRSSGRNFPLLVEGGRNFTQTKAWQIPIGYHDDNFGSQLDEIFVLIGVFRVLFFSAHAPAVLV
jgi:hypothetical protein